MNNKDLKNKSEIKDVGIIVDENLRFSNHIIDKVNKANKNNGNTSKVGQNKRNFNLLYKSLLR